MKLTIFQNPDKEAYEEISKLVLNNDGYCPCLLERKIDTRCLCKEFRDQDCEGECHCGRFVKRLI